MLRFLNRFFYRAKARPIRHHSRRLTLECLEDRVLLNTAPVVNDGGVFSLQHGQTVSNLNLVSYGSDAEGDSLAASITQYPSHGSLSYEYSTGSYSYIAYNNYVDPDSFKFQVNDGALASAFFGFVVVSPYFSDS